MGTSTLLPHFESTITVNNKNLTEHADPSSPEPERTTTRYVEVTTEQTFSITLKAGKDLQFLANGLAINLYIDGNFVDAPTDQARRLGEEIEEGKLKGQALGNSVGFTEPVKGASFDYYSSSLIPDQPSPFVIYIFKSRSLEDLRNLHILPRPASPESLERRNPDTLSATEIVELQQMLRTARGDNVRIKREMVESSGGPRKKARQTRETEQFEVDEDGVRPVGMRLPAVQSEVVVIDD
ncbi:hypothetical protein NU219Hw_g5616t1 [Hortaea werneckii]